MSKDLLSWERILEVRGAVSAYDERIEEIENAESDLEQIGLSIDDTIRNWSSFAKHRNWKDRDETLSEGDVETLLDEVQNFYLKKEEITDLKENLECDYVEFENGHWPKSAHLYTWWVDSSLADAFMKGLDRVREDFDVDCISFPETVRIVKFFTDKVVQEAICRYTTDPAEGLAIVQKLRSIDLKIMDVLSHVTLLPRETVLMVDTDYAWESVDYDQTEGSSKHCAWTNRDAFCYPLVFLVRLEAQS